MVHMCLERGGSAEVVGLCHVGIGRLAPVWSPGTAQCWQWQTEEEPHHTDAARGSTCSI